MKSILALSLLSSVLAAGEYGFSSYYFVDEDRPWHIEGRYRGIASADFETHRRGDVNYADAYGSVYYTQFINEENSLSWELEYDYLKFDWEKNPRFRQKHFNYAVASLGYVSTTLEKWRWIANAGLSVDANHVDFGRTGVYHGMLWGRYHFADCCGIHVGLMGWVGIENGYTLPIFGIDWRWGDHWKTSLIFPLDFSVDWIFDENWSLEAAYSGFGGPYKYPRRADDGIGNFHDPIFEIYSRGGDINLNYQYDHLLRVSVGAGWNFEGWILIKDSENHHGKYYHYEGAPYLQGNLAFTF